MKKIRILLLFIIFINSILLSGCWDMREINELGLVTAVGIDKAEGSNRYSVTVQIANPTSEGSGEGKSKSGNEVWVGTEEGASIFDAVRKLVDISSRRVMWAHNNVVIIGESMAKEGIIPIVDFFTHNPELRLKAAVVIAEGDAKKYIASKIGMEKPSGVAFIALEGYRAFTAESIESHMLNVSAELKGEYSNPLITGIRIKKAIMQSDNGDGGEESSETVELSGAAVFKRDKMLGWLSPEESRGVSWIINETKNTVVTVTDPEHGDRSVSIETHGVKAKIKTDVINGTPKIKINISGSGSIVEEDGSFGKGSDDSSGQELDKMKKHLAGLLDKRIEDEIKHSLEIIQKEYKVDCLGFAAIVHAQNDKEWENGLKDKWQEVFPQIPVTVSVKMNINSSTLNQRPTKIY